MDKFEFLNPFYFAKIFLDFSENFLINKNIGLGEQFFVLKGVFSKPSGNLIVAPSFCLSS